MYIFIQILDTFYIDKVAKVHSDSNFPSGNYTIYSKCCIYLLHVLRGQLQVLFQWTISQVTEAPTANSPRFLSLPSSTALRLDVGQRTHWLMPECMEMKEKDTWDGQLSASSNVMSSIKRTTEPHTRCEKEGQKPISTTDLMVQSFFPPGFITMENKSLFSHKRMVSYTEMSIPYELTYILIKH